MPIGVHPTEFELLLDLYFRRGVSDVVDDWAAPHHPVTRNPGGAPGGPVWTDLDNGLTVLDFDHAIPDFLESPAADTVDLNFTTGDFSLAAWILIDDLWPPGLPPWGNAVLCKSLGNGWIHFISADGAIEFRTFQSLFDYQASSSAAGEIAISTWYLVGVARSGASSRIYKNGTDVTDAAATHVDPLTSASKLYIGINGDETSRTFDGKMWRPRIWGRCLPPDEWAAIFAMERDLFGV